MAIDKKIKYEMQGDEKPARNYLGKQKTVRVPVKWKSGPGKPATQLAYITKAEKDLILKKNLHGSLKNGPNTGPSGIMSLDDQGDYTRDRSPEGKQDAGGNERSRIAQDKHEQHMREVLTGQKNIGQTSAVSDRVRQGAVPEYVNTPDGMKYVGSAYKDTGKRGFFSRLFGGANKYGYAPIQGLKSIQTRGVPGQAGFEYYSDDEDVGDVKPGYGGRIFGGLMSLLTGIPFVGSAVGTAYDYGKGIFGKRPIDMSQYNKLGLFGIPKGTLDEDDKIPVQGDTAWKDGTFTWGANNNINTNKGIPYTNKFTMSGNTYPVKQNIVDDMTTYTDAIEQGENIGNDEQMFIDSQIVNRRFP
jgi:hypothetical protein